MKWRAKYQILVKESHRTATEDRNKSLRTTSLDDVEEELYCFVAKERMKNVNTNSRHC